MRDWNDDAKIRFWRAQLIKNVVIFFLCIVILNQKFSVGKNSIYFKRDKYFKKYIETSAKMIYVTFYF